MPHWRHRNHVAVPSVPSSTPSPLHRGQAGGLGGDTVDSGRSWSLRCTRAAWGRASRGGMASRHVMLLSNGGQTKGAPNPQRERCSRRDRRLGRAGGGGAGDDCDARRRPGRTSAGGSADGASCCVVANGEQRRANCPRKRAAAQALARGIAPMHAGRVEDRLRHAGHRAARQCAASATSPRRPGCWCWTTGAAGIRRRPTPRLGISCVPPRALANAECLRSMDRTHHPAQEAPMSMFEELFALARSATLTMTLSADAASAR